MSTVRLNFSHGNQEEQAVRMILARSVANELNLPISIMLDTNGPEIRLNQISETDNTVKKIRSLRSILIARSLVMPLSFLSQIHLRNTIWLKMFL